VGDYTLIVAKSQRRFLQIFKLMEVKLETDNANNTPKWLRVTLGCCYLVPIYRFRKILAAQGSGISQLTYKSFSGQA